jgi:hypothetical protein
VCVSKCQSRGKGVQGGGGEVEDTRLTTTTTSQWRPFLPSAMSNQQEQGVGGLRHTYPKNGQVAHAKHVVELGAGQPHWSKCREGEHNRDSTCDGHKLETWK